MIEEPKPLTIKKNWERPSKKQLKAFENIPTGFVTDALNGEGTLSIDIKPVGDGRDINCVVVGAAVAVNNTKPSSPEFEAFVGSPPPSPITEPLATSGVNPVVGFGANDIAGLSPVAPAPSCMTGIALLGP